MPKSVEELSKLLNITERELKKATAFLKQSTDLRAPKGAKKAWKNARATVRKIAKKARRRIPKLGKRIKKAKKANKRGPGAAMKWAEKQVGVTESPANSNWGPKVSDWIKFTGYTSPVPWCGCFACYAVVKKGKANIPSRIRLGYAGYIVSDAKAGANGLRAVSASEARAGDIFTIGSAHIGLIAGPVKNGYAPTLEGNTSPTDSGSQYNGGAVARKSRPVSSFAVIARPDY